MKKQTYIQKLGVKFRNKRKEKNYSALEVSEKLGLTVHAVNRFESGTVAMSHKNLIKYAQILNVEIKVKIKDKK